VTEASSKRGWLTIGAAMALTVPAILLTLGVVGGGAEHPSVAETVLYGVAILGSAFLLSWGAEVAQLDISQGLAIAFLAFIAVLPEYAVDLVFAWKAGQEDALGPLVSGICGDEHCRQLAIANMTGANRLLIGLGWAVVVLVWWRKSRQNEVVLGESRRTDLGFLLAATIWAFSIPIRGEVALLDAIVLVSLFLLYLWHAASEAQEHPDLIGPPVAIAALGVARRRAVTIGLFIFASLAILAAAEPFAEGLVHSAESVGLDPFLAVQWLAPLASEAPEMIIAILFVLRSKPAMGLGALVSSKVNQWTLLVGTLPVVYMISRGAMTPMHLDARQVEEVFLTAAQSLFAVSVLANLTISKFEASMLLFLFLAQFGFESTEIRLGFAIAYTAFALVLFIIKRDVRSGLGKGLKHVVSRPV
jgi:cation:H+ antiporter